MMLAPEKRTKINSLNYANSSAILRMPSSGSEPTWTRTDRRSEDRNACRSPTACVSQQAPALLLYSCSSYRCQKGIPVAIAEIGVFRQWFSASRRFFLIQYSMRSFLAAFKSPPQLVTDENSHFLIKCPHE